MGLKQKYEYGIKKTTKKTHTAYTYLYNFIFGYRISIQQSLEINNT